MQKKLNIIITGGSSGLGLGLAKAYAIAGHNLALIARNSEKLAQARADILAQSNHANVLVFSCDVTDTEQTQQTIASITDEFSNIDLVINCAGILREGYFEDISLDTFKQVMDINLFGIINVCHAVIPHLKQNQGQLVNIASMASLNGVFGYTPYCASKHALAGFTESLRFEMKPHDVCVQLICPPEFDSPMVTELNTYRTPENKAHTLLIPMEPLEAIVDATMKAIASKRYFTATGIKASMTALAGRLFPSLVRAIADNTIAKAINSKTKA